MLCSSCAILRVFCVLFAELHCSVMFSLLCILRVLATSQSKPVQDPQNAAFPLCPPERQREKTQGPGNPRPRGNKEKNLKSTRPAASNPIRRPVRGRITKYCGKN